MGGRGSAGGTRSTYRGNNTAEFNARQQSLFNAGVQQGDSGTRGGGGGGQRTNRGQGSSGDTGGIQGGGGNGGGGGAVDTTPTTDVNEQTLPPDADLEVVFMRSDAHAELVKKYAGNPDGFDRAYDKAYSKWLETFESTPKPGPPKPIEITFGEDIPENKKSQYQSKLNKLPLNVRKEMNDRGTRIYFVKRAGDHPDYAETDYGEEKLDDGRTVGDISFYAPGSNQIFISLDNEPKDGSRNIMVHEMGHAIDALWNKETMYLEWEDEDGNKQEAWVDVISEEDPDWIWLHDTHIKDNDRILDYYRGGHNGTDSEGRSELFAEGLASYLEGGRLALRRFVAGVSDRDDRELVIDTMLGVWRRYGIIE